MTRTARIAIVLVALYLLLMTAQHVGAAQAGPQVHCVATAYERMVQLDCFGLPMAEVYERYVPRPAFFSALAPIAYQYSFDLTWTEV